MSRSSESDPVTDSRSPWVRRLQNAALVAGSLLVFLLLAEAVLTGFGYGNLVIFTPDRRLFWAHAPQQQRYTKINRRPVTINSRGTRGAEFDVPKPPDVVRVLSLGDSRTFGWGVGDEETYSHLLRERLQAQIGPGRRVEVINAGVNAWSYDQMYLYLRERALDYDPDLVLLADANLWTEFSDRASPEFVTAFLRRVRLKNLVRRSALYHFVVEEQLQGLYSRLRVLFVPSDPEGDGIADPAGPEARRHFATTLDGIFELLRRRGVPTVVITIPRREALEGEEPPLKAMIRTIKANATREHGVPHIDLTAVFEAHDSDELYIDGDPVHPTVRGHRVIADAIADVVADALVPPS